MRHKQSGIAHLVLVALIAFVALVLVGGGIFVYKTNSKKSTSIGSVASGNDDKTSLTTPLPSDLLSVDKIKELAGNESAGSGLTSVELEAEHGTYRYKVKLANGTILYFDARSGQKVDSKDGSNNSDAAIPADFKAGITIDKAREIALAQKPGGSVSKIELETEEGKVVYSVRFSDDARIDIDAGSGAIVHNRPGKSSSSTSNPTPSPLPSSSSTGSSSSGSSGSGSGNSGSGSSHGRGGSDDDDDDKDDDSSHGGSRHGSDDD